MSATAGRCCCRASPRSARWTRRRSRSPARWICRRRWSPMQRLAALSTLILALARRRSGAPRTADRAWLLARELASLMDEAERAGIDLATRLPDAADPEYAEHWAQTLKFLHIVTGIWPAWLAENGVMNPAARQVALLEAQARAWEERSPRIPRADRRHHRRHPRRGSTAARGRPDAARAGGAAAAGPGHGRGSLARAGSLPRAGRSRAVAGGSGRDARRRAALAERRACRGSADTVCHAVAGTAARRARCTTGWTAAPCRWTGCHG